MNIKEFGLIGAGAQALEAIDIAPEKSIIFLLSTSESEIGRTKNGLPILSLHTQELNVLQTPVLPAVGAPGLKRLLVQQWNGCFRSALVSSNAFVSEECSLGIGSIIYPHATLLTNTVIGKFVIVNCGVTLSHDTKIGDFCTISPGANIGGNCFIGDGVFVGIGATVIQGITIAPGSYIAAGAVVTKNIDKPGTYIGCPAMHLNNHKIWTMSI